MNIRFVGNTVRHVLIALVVLFAISSDAWAWGDQGHKVICEIAFPLAQPNTRAEIRKLIGTDEQFKTFGDACTWPDHPRQRTKRAFREPAERFGRPSFRCLPERNGLRRDGDQEGFRSPVVKQREPGAEARIVEVSRTLGRRHPSTASCFNRRRSGWKNSIMVSGLGDGPEK